MKKNILSIYFILFFINGLLLNGMQIAIMLELHNNISDFFANSVVASFLFIFYLTSALPLLYIISVLNDKYWEKHETS